MPNSKLISENVTKYTFKDRRRRMAINLIVKSGFDAKEVIGVLLEVARNQASVLKTLAPRAFFLKCGDSSQEFVLEVWISEFRDEATTRSDLTLSLQKALAKSGFIDALQSVKPQALPEPVPSE